MGGVKKPIIRLTDEQRRLVEENHNLIYWFINHEQIEEGEDWYGYLAFALCRAAQIWSPEKGAFSTVAYRCFCNQLQHVRKSTNAQKRSRMATVHLTALRNEHDKNYDMEPPCEEDPFEKIEANDVAERCLNELTPRLKPRDAEILRQYVDGGMGVYELAREYGLSHQRIIKILRRIGRLCIEYDCDPRTA